MEQLRGITISTLYAVLGIIAVLIAYLCFHLMSADISSAPVILYLLMALALMSAAMCFKAAWRVFGFMRRQEALQKLDLIPFASITITLLVAIQVFKTL